MSKAKRKMLAVNVVDLGALQIRCEQAAENLRITQDIKIQADRDFKEASFEYVAAGEELEAGLETVQRNCTVPNLLEG